MVRDSLKEVCRGSGLGSGLFAYNRLKVFPFRLFSAILGWKEKDED